MANSTLRYNFFKRKDIGENEITQGTVTRLLSVFARKNVSKHRVFQTIQTGIDIVPVPKFQKLIEKNSFLSRNFTKNEIEYCKRKYNSTVHFAGKFAAKEAVSKALKLEWKEGLNWKEIEIINEDSGAPTAVLSGHAKKAFVKKKFTKLEISISHCNEYAVAVAVVL